jgi:hypothetical protein
MWSDGLKTILDQSMTKSFPILGNLMPPLSYDNLSINYKFTIFILILSLSPDLNAIENCGGMLKSLVQKERLIFNSRDDLVEALQNAHQTMCSPDWRQYFINLCNSMPDRLREVIDNSGEHISYWLLFNTLFVNLLLMIKFNICCYLITWFIRFNLLQISLKSDYAFKSYLNLSKLQLDLSRIV